MKFLSTLFTTIALLVVAAHAFPAGPIPTPTVAKRALVDADHPDVQRRQGAVGAAVKGGAKVVKTLGGLFHHHHKKPAQAANAAANAAAPEQTGQ